MSKLPATGLTAEAVKTAISAPLSTGASLASITQNPWSFYAPSAPLANVSTKVIEGQAGGNRGGNWRYYDHVATAGTSGGNRIVQIYQGVHDDPSDTVNVELQPEFEELNFKRLNSSINSIIVQLYTTVGFGSPLGSAHVHTIIEQTMSPAPPSGHIVTQTKIIQSGSNNWPLVTVTNPWSYSYLYPHIYLSDAANTAIYGQTSDSQVTVQFVKNYKPRVMAGTKDETGDNGGNSWSDIFLGFTAGDMDNGDTSFNFTAQPYLYVPTGGPYTPTFYPILGNFTFTYTYSAVERTIQTLSNTGPDGLCVVTGPLYNAGDGTDTLSWNEIRSINWKINTFSALGAAMENAPSSTSP